MFEIAIRYLVDSDDGTETVLVGGILTLLSWLLLPAVLVAGYLQRVLARTNVGDPAPSFDDWGDLFWTGLRAIAVTIAYFALPVVLTTAVLASLLIFTSETVTEVESSSVTDPATVADSAAAAEPGGLGVLVVLGGLVLALVTSLAAWYVLPAALARLAVEDRFGAAFQLRTLASVVTDGDYATGWLLALVVLAVGGAIVGGLASVPIVGWALIPFAVFYANVTAFALYGLGYRDATRAGRREPVEGDPRVST